MDKERCQNEQRQSEGLDPWQKRFQADIQTPICGHWQSVFMHKKARVSEHAGLELHFESEAVPTFSAGRESR
jgi:hypothetical protein